MSEKQKKPSRGKRLLITNDVGSTKTAAMTNDGTDHGKSGKNARTMTLLSRQRRGVKKSDENKTYLKVEPKSDGRPVKTGRNRAPEKK